MIRYGGHKRYGNVSEVFACDVSKDGKIVEMEEIKHVVRHSPTGMNWGYGGSGPADCALSILTDFAKRTGQEVNVEELYQNFKWAFISHAEDELNINEDQIKEWLTGQNEKKRVVKISESVPEQKK